MPRKPPSSPRDVFREIKEREIQFVDLKFLDRVHDSAPPQR